MKTENNKIIAEFMNWLDTGNKGIQWDLLMEVVHKITILEEFQEWEFNSLFWEVFCQIDITEIYNQVVLFIEYYNENSADKN